MNTEKDNKEYQKKQNRLTLLLWIAVGTVVVFVILGMILFTFDASKFSKGSHSEISLSSSETDTDANITDTAGSDAYTSETGNLEEQTVESEAETLEQKEMSEEEIIEVCEQLVSDMREYEYSMLTDLYWEQINRFAYDFANDNEQRAIAACFYVGYDQDAEATPVDGDENLMRYIIDDEAFAEAAMHLFGVETAASSLPVDKLEGPCYYDGHPTYIESFYENETDYLDISTEINSENGIQIEHTVYCGYWGGNNGTPNYKVIYRFKEDNGQYYIYWLDVIGIEQ